MLCLFQVEQGEYFTFKRAWIAEEEAGGIVAADGAGEFAFKFGGECLESLDRFAKAGNIAGDEIAEGYR